MYQSVQRHVGHFAQQQSVQQPAQVLLAGMMNWMKSATSAGGVGGGGPPPVIPGDPPAPRPQPMAQLLFS